jgi:hypothetical protein
VECRAESCFGGYQTNAASCANGSCPSATLTACAPYDCGPSACATTCGSDAGCGNGYSCNGGVCN